MDFPVIFKACVQPGFDKKELVSAGYEDFIQYFHGRSRINSTNFGWNGHSQSEEVKTKKGK